MLSRYKTKEGPPLVIPMRPCSSSCAWPIRCDRQRRIFDKRNHTFTRFIFFSIYGQPAQIGWPNYDPWKLWMYIILCLVLVLFVLELFSLQHSVVILSKPKEHLSSHSLPTFWTLLTVQRMCHYVCLSGVKKIMVVM